MQGRLMKRGTEKQTTPEVLCLLSFPFFFVVVPFFFFFFFASVVRHLTLLANDV